MHIDPVIEQETRAFAQYFFDYVVDKLKEAGAPDKEYKMPKIVFSRNRTSEEDQEMKVLERKKLSAKCRSIVAIGSPETWGLDKINPIENPDGWNKIYREKEREKAEGTVREMGEKNFQRLKTLKEMMEENVGGEFHPGENRVRFNGILFRQGINYHITAHELLHSIRSQVIKYTEINSGYSTLERCARRKMFDGIEEETNGATKIVEPEIIEFFSELSDIVLDSVGNDHHGKLIIVPPSPDRYLTFEGMEKTNEFFKGDIRKAFSDIVEKYSLVVKQLREGSKEYSENAEKFVNNCLTFAKFDCIYYASIVCNVPNEDYTRFLKTINSMMQHVVGEERVPGEGKEMEVKTDLLTAQLPSFDYLMNQRRPYDFTGLVINENRDRLLNEWPTALLMDPNEIKEIYLKPISERLKERFDVEYIIN